MRLELDRHTAVPERGRRGRRRGGAAALGALAALLVAAGPASGAIVVNEVESDGVADFVELTNTDPVAVDISGYLIKDSNDGNQFTVPGGTTLQAGGFYVANPEPGFGLSSSDAARVFAPGNPVALDTYTWTAHAAATWGRCPDGTGAFRDTASATAGTANDCTPPPTAFAWPGGSTTASADDAFVFGANLSGLAYEPSGTAAPGVLWAVRNGPSTLYRLVWNGSIWTPDTANGWGAGKTLRYGDGGGVPDAEGVTLAAGDPTGIYVSTERNDSGGFDGTSRPAVLRFDVSTAQTTLNATRDWDLTADLPGLGANAGLEAITWVPDDVLVAKGFRVEATGLPYAPASFPDHGAGLFFVGVEQDGRVIAYALNQANGLYTRIASIPSSFAKVMGLEYEAETKLLWAVCDDTCAGRSTTLDVAQSGINTGKFVNAARYERPAGMANLNNEGLAIAPQAECAGGLKPVFYADDANTDGHALRQGSRSCTAIAPPAPPADPPVVVPPAGPPAAPPVGPPLVPADRLAPRLTVALRTTSTGAYAVRRTGKLGLVVVLNERATLTVTVTARRSARAPVRTILRTRRTQAATGRRTLTLTLTPRVRRALRKGEKLGLTVVARDAAGNRTTRRAVGLVR